MKIVEDTLKKICGTNLWVNLIILFLRVSLLNSDSTRKMFLPHFIFYVCRKTRKESPGYIVPFIFFCAIYPRKPLFDGDILTIIGHMAL